jgi:hypothetical protein
MKTWFPLSLTLLAFGCSGTPTTPASQPSPAAAGDHAATAAKSAPQAASAGVVICRHGADERKLEIFTEKTGCVVRYTKQEKPRDIASAAPGSDHCKNVVQKVRGHLEAAGFSCQ